MRVVAEQWIFIALNWMVAACEGGMTAWSTGVDGTVRRDASPAAAAGAAAAAAAAAQPTG